MNSKNLYAPIDQKKPLPIQFKINHIKTCIICLLAGVLKLHL